MGMVGPLFLCPDHPISRMRYTGLVGTLLTLANLLQLAGTLRIAAFNIRTFGETKMSNATLSSYIVKVSSQWSKPESRHAVRGERDHSEPVALPYLGGCQGCQPRSLSTPPWLAGI